MLFYGNLWASLVIFCLSPFFEDRYASYLCEKRRSVLLDEFKEALYSVSASVAAGRQLPRALEDAAESAKMFLGDSSVIYPELKAISDKYRKQNASVEKLLCDFGERSGIEDISLFANSCSICRRSGGDLEELCLKSAFMIIEKIEYGKETEAVLAEKKTDMLILLLMPAVVLFFLNLFSFGYIRTLYECLQGRIVMTAALILIGTAFLWSLKIMKLKL